MRHRNALSRSLFAFTTIAGFASLSYGQLTVANLVRYQVIQRDSTSSSATFTDTGTCRSGTAKVQLLLTNQSDNAVVGSFSWKELSDAVVSGTKWKATMTGVPVGGEYKARFRALNGNGDITDSSSEITNLLVGDIWVCAGQSNMQGAPGVTIDAAHVHTILSPGLGGSSNAWGTSATSGPSTSLGNRLYSLTGVPIGIIYGAVGGTSLTDWFYAPGNNLFSSLSNCARAAVNWKVGGFLWYQGENEDQQDTWALRYVTKFARARDSIRTLSRNPKLPIIVVQLESWDGISSYPLNPYSRWIRWPIIRDQQELLSQLDPYTVTAPIWDAPGIHVTSADEAKLGQRSAASVVRVAYANRSTVSGGPRFKAAWYQDTTQTKIVVQLQDVRGKIVNPADAQHLGFYVMKPSVFDINDSLVLDYGTDSHGQPAKMLKAISSVDTLGADKVVIRLAAATTDSLTVGYGRHIQLISLSPVTDSTGIPLRTFFNRPIARAEPTGVKTVRRDTRPGPAAELRGTVLQVRVPDATTVAVALFDATGRKIRAFVTNRHVMDLSYGLKTGCYVVRVIAQGRTVSAKMALSR